MKLFKIAIWFLLFSFVSAFGVEQSRSVGNLRVVWSEDPQTTALVAWDGWELNENAVLLYDTVSRADAKSGYAFKAPVCESGSYFKIPVGGPKSSAAKKNIGSETLFYHHVKLSGLEPGTVYFLTVKTDGGSRREYHFKTAPDTDCPIKLIYAGDSRTHVDVVCQMSRQIAKLVEHDDSIIALLHGGDFVGDPFRVDMWKKWLEAYSLTTTDSGRLLPIIPVIGNHDGSPDGIFGHAYGDLGTGAGYYTFRLTPSIGIICLDSQQDLWKNQRKFMQGALAGMEKDKVQWRIAAAHKAIYPAIKREHPGRDAWVPLFEQFGVDLMLECDGHCIKRTVPIRNGKESPDGIVYLGEGGYGAPQRDPYPTRWYIQGTNSFVSKGDHFMVLEFAPDGIHYSTILSTGETVDSTIFKPRQR